MQLVKVTWIDADHSNGWIAEDDIDRFEKEEPSYAYGLLVSKTKKFVLLSHEKSGSHWLGIFRIPIGMIRKIEVIQEVGE